MTLKNALLGSGALAVLLDATINSFDLVLTVVDVVFPMVAVTSSYLAPNLDWLSEATMSKLVVFFALLYLVHLSLKLKRRIQNARS